MRNGKRGESLSRKINRRIRRMANRTIRQSAKALIYEQMFYR